MANRRNRNRNRRKKSNHKNHKLNWKSIIIALSIFVVLVGLVFGTIFLLKKLAQVKEVSNLKFESTTSSITLSWKRTQNDATYEIQKKGEDGEYKTVATIEPGKDTLFTESDLPSATLFEYKIIASRGSEKSKVQSNGKTISGYTFPTLPEGFHAMTQSKNSLTISFIDSQKITSYEIKYSENENFADYSILKLAPEELTLNQQEGTLNYLLENLEENHSYYFTIRSVINDKVSSDWSKTFKGHVTKAIDMNGVDPNKPMVAITYDDGPGPGTSTQRIIEAFNKIGGHATFFQLGNRAESYPEQMKMMVDGGHEIGCHTYDHIHMGGEVNKNDIVHANNAIENSCGVRPTVFRSPGGETTDLIRSVCESEGIPVIQWNVDTKDWKTRNAASICDEIKSTIADGNIILMHNIYDPTATATEQILPWIVEQGYQLVTVSQLIQAKTGNPPTAGLQYYTATETK